MFILAVFLCGVLAVIGIYSFLSDLFLRDRARVSKRVDEEFRERQRERARVSALFKLPVGQGPLTPFAPGAPEAEAGPGLRQRLDALVEQSGLSLTPRRLLSIMLITGCSVAAIVCLVTLNILAGLLIGLIAGLLPLLYVSRKRTVRLEKMHNQLPDAFDLMARVIRAGQTISQALQAVGDEFEEPLASEFAYCYEQQNLGLPPEDAMRDLARRTGLLEIKIFVLALLVQQQTGGNLAELLDKLAAVIRQRTRVRSKIRTLTAEGRVQALILLALPPLLLAAVLVLNRQYSQVLLQYPGLLIGMFVAEILGALWIRSIVNFDF
jgi:tight adherence protein B